MLRGNISVTLALVLCIPFVAGCKPRNSQHHPTETTSSSDAKLVFHLSDSGSNAPFANESDRGPVFAVWSDGVAARHPNFPKAGAEAVVYSKLTDIQYQQVLELAAGTITSCEGISLMVPDGRALRVYLHSEDNPEPLWIWYWCLDQPAETPYLSSIQELIAFCEATEFVPIEMESVEHGRRLKSIE